MAVGPRLLVAGPARTPLPFSLWQTVQDSSDPDPHAGNGVSWQPEVCDESAITTSPCPTPPSTKTPTSDGLPSICADAITVYSWVDCGPIGNWGRDGEMFTERATAALLGGEARAIEREFWTGAHGYNPHLAEDAEVLDGDCVLQTAASVLVSGAAIGLVDVIGEIEGAIAECCGSVGVLHVPWRVVAHGFDHHQFEVKAGKLYTMGGTPVVAGAGYPGTSPAGAVPDSLTSWIYGTGPVIGRRSAVKITNPHESLNREINSEVVIAERIYSFSFDTCHFAALANL